MQHLSEYPCLFHSLLLLCRHLKALSADYSLQEACMHMAQYQKQLMAAVNVHRQKQERFTAVAKAQWKESSEKRERLRTFGLRAMVPRPKLQPARGKPPSLHFRSRRAPSIQPIA